MRYIFIILFLLFGSQASSNQVGDVFFCKMKENLGWDWNDNKVVKYQLHEFKFTIVDEYKIKFGQGGTFDDYEMNIDNFVGNILVASSTTGRLAMKNNLFSFTTTSLDRASVIAAICDKF